MTIKMHLKDLPSHKLRLIGPADPSFDERLAREIKPESSSVGDALRPFSVFLENQGTRAVVAYVIEWCFTRPDGSNQYYRKAVLSPQEFIYAESLSPELRRQSGHIEEGAVVFLSLLANDGSGILRTEATAKEVEEIRQGKPLNQDSFLERFKAEAAQFTEITVSIDAAFFDDGTFVGPDSSNFFAQTKAVIDARRDFLNELAVANSKSDKDRDLFHQRIQDAATQALDLHSSSTPADFYNYFKKLSAEEFLRMKDVQGEEKAIAMSIRPMKKPWVTLRKKE